MANTYIAIATVTIGSGGTTSFSFTSIPQSYTDLVIKLSLRGNDSQIYCNPRITFNSDTANNYLRKGMQANGSSVSSNSGTEGAIYYIGGNGATSTANTFGNTELYISNYTSSNQKTIFTDGVLENNATTAYMDFVVYTWANTAAITSITVSNGTNSFVQYSTATLYGIKKD